MTLHVWLSIHGENTTDILFLTSIWDTEGSPTEPQSRRRASGQAGSLEVTASSLVVKKALRQGPSREDGGLEEEGECSSHGERGL